ncbi:hypothetical protein KP509_16G065700 [Ceratopteris richardii]|uniref:SNF2 N-terminal domain-containing protein n=1 Tax=Ceratopteris richardii TaxID=49495 RepID=A0A8T2SZJ0_CERRI|nr:hypothetical protein KP509_16G065700 [Ceratopteris richardii]
MSTMILRKKHMPSSITPSFSATVTPHEVVINDWKFLSKYKSKYIVVDEDYILKNFKCKLLRELKQMPAENTCLLTGVPLQNNLPGWWSLLNLILLRFLHLQASFDPGLILLVEVAISTRPKHAFIAEVFRGVRPYHLGQILLMVSRWDNCFRGWKGQSCSNVGAARRQCERSTKGRSSPTYGCFFCPLKGGRHPHMDVFYQHGLSFFADSRKASDMEGKVEVDFLEIDYTVMVVLKLLIEQLIEVVLLTSHGGFLHHQNT